MAKLTNLVTLYLDRNQFDGPFPIWIPQLTQLLALSISDNAFMGSLPYNIGDLTHLRLFQINENHLTGVIPASIGNIGSQTTDSLVVDLSWNQFSGAIPESIWNFAAASPETTVYLFRNCLVEPAPANPTPSAPRSSFVAEAISDGIGVQNTSCAL